MKRMTPSAIMHGMAVCGAATILCFTAPSAKAYPTACWLGSWGEKPFVYTFIKEGDELTASTEGKISDAVSDPVKFKDCELHKARNKDTRQEDDFINCTFESNPMYSDPTKSGVRKGDVTLHYVRGWFRSGDKLIGKAIERGNEIKRKDPNTAMHPGKEWELSMGRNGPADRAC